MLLTLVLLSLCAQEPPAPPPQDEKKVVVTASPLNPKDLFDTPFSSDVVTAQDRERINPRTLTEVLKETPGIGLQKSGYGQSSPFIRGFTGFRTLMLIDGIRLNNSAFRDGPNQYWITVDGHIIDTLEVVRGPSSVLYGSDALGGTVLASTADIAPGFHSLSAFRWASAEDSYIAREEVSWASADGAGGRIGFTYRDLHNLSGGRDQGTFENTGYDEYDADLKLAFPLGGGWRLTGMYQRHRLDEAPRTHSTVYASQWHGTTPGTDQRRDFDQRRELFYLQAARESEDFRARFGLSWHAQGETSRRTTSSLTQEFRRFDVTTPGIIAAAGFRTGVGFITAGADFYRDSVRSSGQNTNAAGTVTYFDRGEIADDSTVDLAGLFIQDEISFGALDVALGLRFNYNKIEADKVDPTGLGGTFLESFTETYTALAGSLRFLYHVDEHWNVIAGVSQGFRAPNLDDTTAVRLVLSGQTDFPNPDVDPETSINFELGGRAKYDSTEAGAFVFYTLLDDFIVRVPAPLIGPTAFTKENADRGWAYGAEVYAKHTIADEWHIWLNGAYTFGKVDQFLNGATDEEPLGKLPPLSGSLGVRWQKKDSKLWAEAVMTSARHQGRLSPGDLTDTQRIPPGGTPGYTVYTLRGGYEFCAQARATLAIENLADKDYRVHGSGVNEPGTNVVIGMELRF